MKNFNELINIILKEGVVSSHFPDIDVPNEILKLVGQKILYPNFLRHDMGLQFIIGQDPKDDEIEIDQDTPRLWVFTQDPKKREDSNDPRFMIVLNGETDMESEDDIEMIVNRVKEIASQKNKI